MNIKKMIVAATLSALVLAGTFAETNAGGHKKSEISYYSAPVYKVMDSAKAYTVDKNYALRHNRKKERRIPKGHADCSDKPQRPHLGHRQRKQGGVHRRR